jgi:Ricin-type beta-trefoil lectin domain
MTFCHVGRRVKRGWDKNPVTRGKPSEAMGVSALTEAVLVREVDQVERMHTEMLVLRSISGVRRALMAVRAVFGVAVLSAGVGSADGPVQLRSRLGNFCLDRPDGNMFSATVINRCDGSQSQRWNLTAAKQIESVAFPGMCLNMPNDQWWSAVRPCADSFVEHWTIQPNGQVTTDFGARLTVLGGANPATWVSTRACNADAPDQEWDVVP